MNFDESRDLQDMRELPALDLLFELIERRSKLGYVTQLLGYGDVLRNRPITLATSAGNTLEDFRIMFPEELYAFPQQACCQVVAILQRAQQLVRVCSVLDDIGNVPFAIRYVRGHTVFA